MCRCDNFFYHLLLDTYRHYPLNENVRITLQLEGSKYFPVTYCSKECFASGAKEGWVMAASVTNPATDTDTTNMPPKKKFFLSDYLYICITWTHFNFRQFFLKKTRGPVFNSFHNSLRIGICAFVLFFLCF